MFQTKEPKWTTWFFQFVSYGSFDVVVSVGANLSFLSHYYQTPLRVSQILFYLVSVWGLYLLDHLWDAKKEIGTPTLRSLFFGEHQTKIKWMIVFSVVLSCSFVLVWEWKFLFANQIFLISFGVILLLVVKRLSPFPKEILVSVFYTWGILLPFPMGTHTWWVAFLFFQHVFANVLFTYNLDRDIDKSQETFVLSRFLSLEQMQFFSRGFLGFGLLCLSFSFFFQSIPLVFCMGLCLSYLWLLTTSFLKQNATTLKSLAELSYLPMFLPQIIFFFSGLR